MGYNRGDSFTFNFEPNGIQFSSKSKGKLSPTVMKENGNIVFSVYLKTSAAMRHREILI